MTESCKEERLGGLLEGVQLNQIKEDPIIVTDKNYIDALNLLDLKAKRTAIMCSCDLYALETMNFLKEKGLRIPEDIGVMGFDNIDVLKYITPRLSTVHYNVEQMGKCFNHLLFDNRNHGISPAKCRRTDIEKCSKYFQQLYNRILWHDHNLPHFIHFEFKLEKLFLSRFSGNDERTRMDYRPYDDH